ncbi:MATE family efflux transporter ['Osedax' symbiont bacterium Rs2_46_30_T18]|nr:MATE family efflux transporter ['Osedax' symbiont bacterium Rs2_46_30_T18]
MKQNNKLKQYATELSKTFSLAWPLVIAQLAVIAINTTDVVMMGWLGPEYLAAGTLSTAIVHPFLLAGLGLLSVVTPLVAQNLSTKNYTEIRRTTRQGLWLAALMSLIFVPLLLQIESIILMLGLDASVAKLAATYMDTAVWYLIPVFLFFVLRNLVSAHSDTKVILQITLVAIALNALGNYALMFGHFGFERMELRGAGISTTFVNTMMFLALLGYVLKHPRYKKYSILVRIYKPDWSIFRKILKLGGPVGLMIASESGLFSAAAILMGWLGTAELAGHAIALQITAIAFMIPLGLSNATTIRVGYAYGLANSSAVNVAGWVSIGLGIGCMIITLIIFYLFPQWLIHLFLDPEIAANATAIAYAVSYLLVVTLFQIADGGQVVAAAALRGINDTKVPMYVAIVGYWIVGMPVAYILGFTFELRGVGVWLGLAAGLIFVAIVLIYRFWRLAGNLKFSQQTSNQTPV